MQSYTRHKLKQDKFAETAQEAVHWASGHRLPVLWVTGIVLVLAAAAVGWFFWNGRQSEQANVGLGKAMRTATAPLRAVGEPAQSGVPSFTSIADRGKQAEKEFKEVADKFPLTKAGKIARYMEGTAAIQAGDTAAAEKELKEAAGFGNHDISSMAKLALANLYRGSNRQSDAAKLYKDLADHPSDAVSKAEAQLELAEMYEITDPQEAKNIYQQIEKENPSPNDPAGSIAASKLRGGK